MATTSMVHVRVDDKIKLEATETLASMGLSVSDAVRVFLTRVVVEYSHLVDHPFSSALTTCSH